LRLMLIKTVLIKVSTKRMNGGAILESCHAEWSVWHSRYLRLLLGQAVCKLASRESLTYPGVVLAHAYIVCVREYHDDDTFIYRRQLLFDASLNNILDLKAFSLYYITNLLAYRSQIPLWFSLSVSLQDIFEKIIYVVLLLFILFFIYIF
jgi:hypothetical protein